MDDNEVSFEMSLDDYEWLVKIANEKNISVEEIIVEILRNQLEVSNEICESN